MEGRIMSQEDIHERSLHAEISCAKSLEDVIESRVEDHDKLEEESLLLGELGDIYSERARNNTEELEHFTKSSALYNAALVRTKCPNASNLIQSKLYNLWSLFLHSVCSETIPSADEWRAEKERNKENLKKIRCETEHEITCIPKLWELYDKTTLGDENREEIEEKIIKVTQHLGSLVSDEMKGLFVNLFGKCLAILGSPPCDYAVIGFGSLARNEVTPYSDLEFAILIPELQDAKHSAQLYFRQWTTLLHLMILDFGETVLPAMAIQSLNDFYGTLHGRDWFYDDITPSGLKLDADIPWACKTPLGRKKKGKVTKDPVELICSPAVMASYLDVDREVKEGYHLADILSCVVFISGREKLFQDFEKQAKCRLVKYGRDETRLKMFEAELAKYPFDESEPGFLLFKVKQDMFRFPSLAINHLRLLHNLPVKTPWEVIDQLAERGILTPEGAHNLKLLSSITVGLRLVTYSNLKAQRENISFFASYSGHQASQSQNYSEYHVGALEILLTFLRIAKPLLSCLVELPCCADTIACGGSIESDFLDAAHEVSDVVESVGMIEDIVADIDFEIEDRGGLYQLKELISQGLNVQLEELSEANHYWKWKYLVDNSGEIHDGDASLTYCKKVLHSYECQTRSKKFSQQCNTAEKLAIFGPAFIWLSFSYIAIDCINLSCIKRIDVVSSQLDLRMPIECDFQIPLAWAYFQQGHHFRGMQCLLEEYENDLKSEDQDSENANIESYEDFSETFMSYFDDDAMNDIRNAVSVVKNVFPGDMMNNSFVAIFLYRTGMVLQQSGFLEEAKELLEQAMDIFVNIFGVGDPFVLSCKVKCIGIERQLGNMNEARDLIQEEKEINDTRNKNTVTSYSVDMLTEMSMVEKQSNNDVTALDMLGKALKIANLLSADSIVVEQIIVSIFIKIVLLLERLGWLVEALKVCEEAWSTVLCTEEHGEILIFTKYLQTRLLYKLDRWEDAKESAYELLAHHECDLTQCQLLSIYGILADVAGQNGCMEEADDHYRVMETLLRCMGELSDVLPTQDMVLDLVTGYMQIGQAERAKSFAKWVAERGSQACNGEFTYHYLLATAYRVLGGSCLKLRDVEQSFDLFQNSRKMYEQIPYCHGARMYTTSRVGITLLGLGKITEAKQRFRESVEIGKQMPPHDPWSHTYLEVCTADQMIQGCEDASIAHDIFFSMVGDNFKACSTTDDWLNDYLEQYRLGTLEPQGTREQTLHVVLLLLRIAICYQTQCNSKEAMKYYLKAWVMCGKYQATELMNVCAPKLAGEICSTLTGIAIDVDLLKMCNSTRKLLFLQSNTFQTAESSCTRKLCSRIVGQLRNAGWYEANGNSNEALKCCLKAQIVSTQALSLHDVTPYAVKVTADLCHRLSSMTIAPHVLQWWEKQLGNPMMGHIRGLVHKWYK